MKWYIIVFTILITSKTFIEKQQPATAKINLNYRSDSVTGRTIIINAFDVNTMHARKNKKALFYSLTDTLKYLVKTQMDNNHKQAEMAAQPFINISQGDSIVFELLRQNKAAYALVIKDYDVYFEQKDVEVLKDEGGTHRNASYNIYCVINYAYFDSTHLIKESRVSVFHYFSTRSVISGLFAAGPNIVSNKEAAISITADNVSEYFRLHFPW